MARALITGGAGFLGGHLADAFARQGWEVRLLDIREPAPRGPHEFVRADVRDQTAVARAARECELVIDNAALVPVTRARAEAYRSVNVDGSTAALTAARKVGAYAIHISSSAIYGIPRELPVMPSTPLAPFEPYGLSKAAAEQVVEAQRKEGLPVCSLRPRTLLGAGRLGIFDVIFARIRAGRRVPIFGNGENVVQMCDVADFCAAALAAVRLRANGDFNVGAQEYATVRDDLNTLIDHAGTGAVITSVPSWTIRSALKPLALIGRSPFTEWHWRSAPESFYFDISETMQTLDWAPQRSNAEALVAAYEHYLQAPALDGAGAHVRPLRGTVARALRGW
jgi:nucleoside-diphosphate-sugar epimerase